MPASSGEKPCPRVVFPLLLTNAGGGSATTPSSSESWTPPRAKRSPTKKAWALHYVDNLDAKMEMMTAAYATSRQLAPRIQERVWPLPGNLVAPLEKFVPPEAVPPDMAS